MTETEENSLRPAFAAEMQEQQKHPIEFTTDYGMLFAVISAVQMACRHPSFTGAIRSQVERFVQDVKPLFGPVGQRVIDMGADPQHDVPFKESSPEAGLSNDVGARQIFIFLHGAGETEGPACYRDPESGVVIPMMVHKHKDLPPLLDLASSIVRMGGEPLILAKFSQRTDLQTFSPLGGAVNG